MTIADAPFVGIAVPVEFSPISKAYWQTNASIHEIAVRFSLKTDKQSTKRAGKAVLRGVACKHCGKDVVAKNRGDAISILSTFNQSTPKFNRVACDPCYRDEQMRRLYASAGKKWTGKIEAKAANVAKSKPAKAPTASVKEEFYQSWEWRTLRMEALKQHGRSCQCCGAAPGHLDSAGKPVRICVDHIKPLSKFWNLRLERSNLQILCDECNQGKGNWDETDFRPAPAPDEWIIEDDGIDPRLLAQLDGGRVLQ